MRRRYTTFTLLLLDAVCGVGLFNLARLLRGLPGEGDYLLGSLLVPLGVTMVALRLVDGYSPRCDMLSADYASQHLVAFTGATLTVLLITHALLTNGYPLQMSRLVTLVAMAAYAITSLGYRRAIHLRRLEQRGQRSLLFVGDRPSLQSFTAECGRPVSASICTRWKPTPPARAHQRPLPRSSRSWIGRDSSSRRLSSANPRPG
jgi:hypothetical protein